MKTAMIQLIQDFKLYDKIPVDVLEKYVEKEKQQIIDAYKGSHTKVAFLAPIFTDQAYKYYDRTYETKKN